MALHSVYVQIYQLPAVIFIIKLYTHIPTQIIQSLTPPEIHIIAQYSPIALSIDMCLDIVAPSYAYDVQLTILSIAASIPYQSPLEG